MARLLLPNEMVETIKGNDEAACLDRWCLHCSSGDVNKVKYPVISVTATDESIIQGHLQDICAATTIHSLIKERTTKMENEMTAKIELLNTFEKWANNCHDEEFRKYLLVPSGTRQEQEALKKSHDFDDILHVLVEIKRDLVNADQERDRQLNVLCPVNIWENGNNTVVQWEDGTKTVVTAEHPESKSTFAGFCAALAKKIYGTTDKVMKQIDKAVENPKLPAKRKKEEAERLKLGREIQHEMRVKERELRIKREMDQIYIKEEAKKRIDQAHEERMYEQPKKKTNKKQPQKKSKPKEEAKHE